ncbi:MAG TPA: FprA family A-type flavoprotein [Acidilobales archaeon]|nr:FprA family A-type flavoprotein [Acidilobales archaeon]
MLVFRLVKTHVGKVIGDLYVFRVDDVETKYFEALWYIPEGITYNAYLLIGDKVVLFDGWKGKYSDLLIDELSRVVDVKDIDYVVIHHMEQDHSGSLPKVLEANGFKATVVAHPMVRGMIGSFYGIKPKFKVVKDGEVLKLGKYSLRFIYTPWLHWPETIVSYVEELGTLISCDVFGAYSIPRSLFDDELSKDELGKYLDYARKYVITVVGHYKDYIIKGIDKIKSLGLDIKVIAPAHGLIWRRESKVIVSKYVGWAEGKPKDKKVTVIYDSMYGYVKEAMEVLIGELVKVGAEVKVHAFTEDSHPPVSDVLSDVADSQVIVIGVSTYEGGAFPEILRVAGLMAMKATYRKPVIIVTAYGWGGIATKQVKDLLTKAGYEVIKTIEFKGKPKEEHIKDLKNIASTIIT